MVRVPEPGCRMTRSPRLCVQGQMTRTGSTQGRPESSSLRAPWLRLIWLHVSWLRSITSPLSAWSITLRRLPAESSSAQFSTSHWRGARSGCGVGDRRIALKSARAAVALTDHAHTAAAIARECRAAAHRQDQRLRNCPGQATGNIINTRRCRPWPDPVVEWIDGATGDPGFRRSRTSATDLETRMVMAARKARWRRCSCRFHPWKSG